ncbi:sugar transferase [Leeia sp. TBRC 13508]|uniref:Sugar transferase n=1 Tax=Leeia speluncae TaxID=2884804 RepID=A0ABS8D1U8_9NEIS|nr:sugar transferase [Leeia speluncae]MCB6182164.1 sugar transferase [Leeia speluncae]
MLKRCFDFLAAVFGLLVLSPVFIVVALWIRADSPGPIFFRQERVGRFGETFRIHKFRTMRVDAERAGLQITVGQDNRITKSGEFLRHYKLDELPQLIDVLVGSMSLVGPRPEVPRYVAVYPEDVRKIVLSVRPGITDLASIEYRHENALLGASSNPEKTYIEEVMPAKLALNCQYVKTQSLWLDIRLILKTLQAILH